MSIWSKVLIGLIAFLALPLFILSMMALRIHDNWRSGIDDYERAIAREEATRLQLLDGTADEPGIRQLEVALHARVVDRGRVWHGAMPGQITAGAAIPDVDLEALGIAPPGENADPAAAEDPAAVADPAAAAADDTAIEPSIPVTVTVTIEDPVPHHIDDQSVLYVFDGRPVGEGGSYLGQFKVASVGETNVVLDSSIRMSYDAIKRLKDSPGPWSLYEVMPRDNHQAFAEVPPEELERLLPAATVEQYKKDGQPAGPNDPPEVVVDGNYVRPLRDYGVIIQENVRLRTIELDELAAARNDLAHMTAAHEIALAQEQSRNDQIAQMEQELAEITRQRDAVAQRQQQLEGELSEVRTEIERLFAANKVLAAQWAQQQRDAARAARQQANPSPETSAAR